jgi:hypothetical protein
MTVDRRTSPLFHQTEVKPPPKATGLDVEVIDVQLARNLIGAWHSRLPTTQRGPWKIAYAATYQGTAFAVALWHNPSARMLPGNWLELRRMAVAPDAPHCTASRMLALMVKDLAVRFPDAKRAISYQDEDVHLGTIYKAAGWTAAHRTARRQRDRSTNRPSGRLYRTSINGAASDSSPKTRWEKEL